MTEYGIYVCLSVQFGPRMIRGPFYSQAALDAEYEKLDKHLKKKAYKRPVKSPIKR